MALGHQESRDHSATTTVNFYPMCYIGFVQRYGMGPDVTPDVTPAARLHCWSVSGTCSHGDGGRERRRHSASSTRQCPAGSSARARVKATEARYGQGRQTAQPTQESPRTNVKLPPTDAIETQANLDCSFRHSGEGVLRSVGGYYHQQIKHTLIATSGIWVKVYTRSVDGHRDQVCATQRG